MKPSKINTLNNFIAGGYIKKQVCDNLIKFFENSPDKQTGKMSIKGEIKEFKKYKVSTDLIISPLDPSKVFQDYLKELNKALEIYKNKYNHCSFDKDFWTICETWNIQKYKPKEGFFEFHSERTSVNTMGRHLVFMTYLNDVKDGGETEFFYQKLRVKPEKGLTIIWPADWTFTHKGITSPTENKYIATGWYSFDQNQYVRST